MYAYTSNSYRAIQAGWPLADAETAGESVPVETLLNIRSEEATREISLKIASTNWALMPDADVSALEKTAILAYRAALRALPSHQDFPEMPWPVLPGTSGVGNQTGEQS